MAFDPAADFPISQATIDEIEAGVPGARVLSFHLDQTTDPSGPTDSYVETTFEVEGKPGIFTIREPFDWQWDFNTVIDMALFYHQIQLAYAL